MNTADTENPPHFLAPKWRPPTIRQNDKHLLQKSFLFSTYRGSKCFFPFSSCSSFHPTRSIRMAALSSLAELIDRQEHQASMHGHQFVINCGIFDQAVSQCTLAPSPNAGFCTRFASARTKHSLLPSSLPSNPSNRLTCCGRWPAPFLFATCTLPRRGLWLCSSSCCYLPVPPSHHRYSSLQPATAVPRIPPSWRLATRSPTMVSDPSLCS